MERRVSLEEISDGRLYEGNDLVKADCRGCVGCSACCRGMGDSVILDPLDVYRLTKELQVSFEVLLKGRARLHVVDGIILPSLKMEGPEERCTFLNSQGRCSVHPARPGFCRLFPLGRVYENRSFRYFLQIHQCPRENRTKVKVKKWIDTPNLKEYEAFVNTWHYFLKDAALGIQGFSGEEREKVSKTVNLRILEGFFVRPYDLQEDFYPQFYARLTAESEYMADLGITLA